MLKLGRNPKDESITGLLARYRANDLFRIFPSQLKKATAIIRAAQINCQSQEPVVRIVSVPTDLMICPTDAAVKTAYEIFDRQAPGYFLHHLKQITIVQEKLKNKESRFTGRRKQDLSKSFALFVFKLCHQSGRRNFSQQVLEQWRLDQLRQSYTAFSRKLRSQPVDAIRKDFSSLFDLNHNMWLLTPASPAERLRRVVR
jgi:hypothetical protein